MFCATHESFRLLVQARTTWRKQTIQNTTPIIRTIELGHGSLFGYGGSLTSGGNVKKKTTQNTITQRMTHFMAVEGADAVAA